MGLNGVITKNVKEINNEWYEWVNVEEMDAVSVLNNGWSCSVLNTQDANFIINDICTNMPTS